MSFKANYNGICMRCRGRFAVEDSIDKAAGLGYIHARCMIPTDSCWYERKPFDPYDQSVYENDDEDESQDSNVQISDN